MAEPEVLVAKLNQIKRLADEVLEQVTHQAVRTPSKTAKAAPRPPHSRKTLPTEILRLRDEQAFFRQSKTVPEVHHKLQSTYPCDLNRVAVALHRLQKRRQLRKTSKGQGKKKQVAYVW